MFDQFFSAVLFLFNLLGSVRGESTESATLATASAEQASNPASLISNFTTAQTQARLTWEEKRASFAATLISIKNEKKQTILETLQNRLYEINKTQTTLLMNRLEKLSWALTQIKNQTTAYQEDTGKDTTHSIDAIAEAQQVIADAMVAVTLQSEKTYVMTVTSESTAKKAFETQRKLLSDDLKKVRDMVKNAGKKVGDALKALKTLTGKPVFITVPEHVAL